MDGVLPDWEAIEAEYRAGTASIREIARQHGITDKAIRKRATAGGWQRDLSEKVKEAVRNKLVRSEVRTPNVREPVRTDAESIEAAAETAVQVVQIHRRDVRNGRTICAALFAELQDTSANRELIAECIESETQDDLSPNRRNQMLKAVSLPTRARELAARGGRSRWGLRWR